MGTSELIKALGGPTAVARALGLRVQAVSNWATRGEIPRQHHIAVWRLAAARDVSWTPPDAEGMTLTPASSTNQRAA